MPTIAVNLGDVQVFENLPVGTYEGEIEKIVLMEAADATKNDQLRAQYIVIDGDHVGRRQSEFRSFSPKAMGFMKQWFMKFGLGDIPNLDFDDDSNELLDPDLYGSRVIFEVTADAKAPGGLRTSLVEVTELGPGVPGAAPQPEKAAAKPAAKPAPVVQPAPVVDPKAAARAALEAQLKALEEGEAAEAEPAGEAEPEPPKVAAKAPPAPQRGVTPVRRTLR